MIRLFFATTLLFLGLSNSPAFGCENAECELDCRDRCEECFLGECGTEPICFNACLSEEHVCKARIDAANLACRSMTYYWQAYAAVKELKNQSVVNDKGQCMNANWLAGKVAERYGGELAQVITTECGCHICKTLF
jgi:hypothetical protein